MVALVMHNQGRSPHAVRYPDGMQRPEVMDTALLM